jgi:D-glycero-D-manno-heptose 1,7-bisphosphate phosphatase
MDDSPVSAPKNGLPDGARIDSDGVWAQLLNPTPAGRAALFLDRDGVVVEEAHFLRRAEDMRLIDGAAPVIAHANRCRIPVVIVTNQSGIGRGYFGWDAFTAVQGRIVEDLAAAGASVNAVLACPHHATGNPPYDHPNHPARKPNPGMLLRAAELLSLDLSGSWIVGDHASDIGAGFNAGLAGGVHVLTGHGTHDGQREAAMAFSADTYQVLNGASIVDALKLVPLLK